MVRAIIGVLLGAVGVVWIAQGVGMLHGSPMTGEAIWAVFGTLLLIAAVWLIASAARLRKKREHDPSGH